MTNDAATESAPLPPLPAATVWLFAAVSALTAANLYYHQPLLANIARDFRVPESRAGLISTVTQMGYAVGILFFVPLADVRERRRLSVVMLVAVAAALGAASLAPSLGWLTLASFLVGVTTIVPQLVLPFAAGLARPAERGRVIGLVMGGLLIGILGARTLSGFFGAAFGWRAVFAGAAALMLVLAVVSAFAFPRGPTTSTLSYGALLRSLLTLARAQPVLREAALIGALVFGAFSAFWTTLAFRLETPPLHYGARVAGLFGLVGIVGALTAPAIGRVADRRSPRTTVGLGIALVIAAFLAFLLAGSMIAGLVVGVILLDAGSQATGVSNQARIYSLPLELHARLNTVYMVAFFVGGSVGSTLGAWAWGRWRWAGVVGVGLGMAVGAFGAFWRGGRRTG
jgi:predicted MFS family arabinose efflux permease